MKVLKKGIENDKLETMEVSCTGKGFTNKKPCGALLEVNGLDILSDIHYDYGGGSDKYYYIICPECGSKTEIYEKDIPHSIRTIIQ